MRHLNIRKEGIKIIKNMNRTSKMKESLELKLQLLGWTQLRIHVKLLIIHYRGKRNGKTDRRQVTEREA